MEHMKLGDHNAYSTASVSALEPAGYQKASTASGTKRKRQSDTDLEDLQPLKKGVLCLVAINYLNTTPPQSMDERNEFLEFLEKTRTCITGVFVGSLVITVKCDSLKSLEELWKEYSCGRLGKMVQDCFVTEKILKELNLAELKLKTTMDIEEYNAYKLYFLEKDALRGQLKERKRPGPLKNCFEMIKNTTHHLFNMVHHRVNRGVEGGPGFDQDRNNYFMTKLMLTMYTMTICSLK